MVSPMWTFSVETAGGWPPGKKPMALSGTLPVHPGGTCACNPGACENIQSETINAPAAHRDLGKAELPFVFIAWSVSYPIPPRRNEFYLLARTISESCVS